MLLFRWLFLTAFFLFIQQIEKEKLLGRDLAAYMGGTGVQKAGDFNIKMGFTGSQGRIKCVAFALLFYMAF